VKGMTVEDMEGPTRPYRESLQTNHNYSSQAPYQVNIRTPITVSETLPFIFVKDIAIVEPGNDSVVVEATTNGLDWITLKSYDASYSTSWQSAFIAKENGSSDMYSDHAIDFSEHFEVGALVLFRLRLMSNPSVTGWGWSIDHVSIQEVQTSVERPSAAVPALYPNPSYGIVNIDYVLEKSSNVGISVSDVFGRRIIARDLGFKNSGNHHSEIDITGHAAGTYIVILKTEGGNLIQKIILKNGQ
jgi:hypothetical protein